MSDTKSEALTVEVITRCIDELAQEVGAMEPDNPRWATVLEELFQLTQLWRAVKFASTPVVEQYTDELAREMTTLKPGDPRRAEIAQHIARLSDLAKEI
jgi:DNA repair ATPase RecN